jgi:hypothetical protein
VFALTCGSRAGGRERDREREWTFMLVETVHASDNIGLFFTSDVPQRPREDFFLNLTKLDYFNFYLDWCFLSVKLWWLTNSNSPLLIETLADDVLKLTKLQISVRWPVSSD